MRFALRFLLAIWLPCICAAGELASDRAIQFLVNVHTGTNMSASEWLLSSARDSDRFASFGGLDRMVRQTSELAHRYGGLRAIELKSVSPTDRGFLVTAEVKFIDDDKRKASPAAAVREDMVWKLRAEKEGGVWKLAF